MDKTPFYDQQAQKYSPLKTIRLERQGLKKLFSFDDRFLQVVNKLSEIIQKSKQKNLKILDVGCGDGFYERQIIRQRIKNCQFYGVDISQKQLEKTKNIFSKSHKLNIDNQKLPFKNNFFDTVILSEILEHLFNPKFAIQEAQRVLKKGGYLFLTAPNSGALQIRLSLFFTGKSLLINYPQNEQHIRFFNRSGIEKLVSLKKVYFTGVGSCFFDHWNFPLRLPTPRILQITVNKFFPNLSLGLFFIFQKA